MKTSIGQSHDVVKVNTNFDDYGILKFLTWNVRGIMWQRL